MDMPTIIQFLRQPSYILTVLFLGAAELIGLGVGVSMLAKAPVGETTQVSSASFLIAFFIATLLLLFFLKYVKRPIVFQVLFFGALIEGVLIFSSAFFASPQSILIALAILFSLFWFRNVLMHDVTLILALAGIGAFFGLQLSPASVIVILIFLALYDYWAVYKSKHMVRMFKEMAEQKVHFALIIPVALKRIFTKLRFVETDKTFFFLGTGDVALPLIFAVSSLNISITTSLSVVLGSLVGYTGLYLWFITHHGKPMAGLPPILTGALLGFCAGYFFL